MGVMCVKIEKKLAEKARRILKSHNLINKNYSIYREGDYVFIPISDEEETVSILSRNGVEASVVECNPPQKEYLQFSRIPSYDLVDDIIIIREKAVNEYGDINELVKLLTSLHPKVKAIYVKEYTESVFRVSRLKLLWGTDVEEVFAKEYGLKFFVKIKDVYYNPRLSTEHRRLAESVSDGEVVFDLFAGIGGFSIHIASLHKVKIYANDINPVAVYCMLKNIMLNRKMLKGEIIVSLADARKLINYIKPGSADRIIANLPHESLKFIDVYNYLSREGTVLHIYVLGKEEDMEGVMTLLESRGWSVESITPVIDYAPHKFIYRIDAVKRNDKK
ncbi:50S ribosomal protein L11 methyltransferase [Desulfurococcaceae archaeon MEX13E-LK6-19]|nr:50S ribosomal protein L11 methyltransferase [Desulfurococcaceae archaeon MEX13E-LK6-19]